MKLYNRSKFIELRDIAYKEEDIKSLLKSPENSDYKLEVTIYDGELMLIIKPLIAGNEIKSTNFIVNVNIPNIGFRNGDLHLLAKKEKKLKIENFQFGPKAIGRAKSIG